jgi:REP element-mobilizing transposase RayT
MVRGIERCRIFRSDTDREDLVSRLADIVAASGMSVYGWSLLPNHFHLLSRTGKVGLSHVMRRLLTGYAVTFNRRHRRVGHLFQNRFKSILVEEEPYFIELVRYIHLNPLRAGAVTNLDELDGYPWSGHSTLVGRLEREWQDTEYVMRRFGGGTDEARKAYEGFVADGVSEGRRPDLVGGGLIRSIGGRQNLTDLTRGRERWAFDERVLGSSEFVIEAWEEQERRREASVVDPDRQTALLNRLIGVAARRLGVRRGEVVGGSRRRAASRCRRVVSYVAISEFGIPAVRVAEALGVSVPAVSGSVSGGKALMRGMGWTVGEFTRELK